jgi:hypothetical protein
MNAFRKAHVRFHSVPACGRTPKQVFKNIFLLVKLGGGPTLAPSIKVQRETSIKRKLIGLTIRFFPPVCRVHSQASSTLRTISSSSATAPHSSSNLSRQRDFPLSRQISTESLSLCDAKENFPQHANKQGNRPQKSPSSPRYHIWIIY